MTKRVSIKMIALMAVGLIGSSSSTYGDLLLDIQPTGGTIAAGYQALEATNQVLPTGSTTYTAASTGFGSDVQVALSVANLLDAELDFRAVARDGAATDFANDWIGVDARGAFDSTLIMTFSGLSAGNYNWTSWHEDGGTGTTNGNIDGLPDYSLVSSSGTETGSITQLAGNANGPGLGAFSTTFTSDGSDVVFSMVMTEGQGGGLNSIFAFATAVEISTATAVPEPTSLGLIGLGLIGFAAKRRRK